MGKPSDMDILLTNAACTRILAASAAFDEGNDPVEIFDVTNTGTSTTFGVIILKFTGPNPSLMKYVNFGSSAVAIDEFDTMTGASWGHSAALGGSASGPPITGKPLRSTQPARHRRLLLSRGHANPLRHRA